MKRLTLLRHAKSDWDDPVARDFDRPLNQRGEKAARLMGKFAARQGMRFDQLVASPAERVVQTLDAFFTGYGETLEARWDRRIYLASSATLFDVVRDLLVYTMGKLNFLTKRARTRRPRSPVTDATEPPTFRMLVASEGCCLAQGRRGPAYLGLMPSGGEPVAIKVISRDTVSLHPPPVHPNLNRILRRVEEGELLQDAPHPGPGRPVRVRHGVEDGRAGDEHHALPRARAPQRRAHGLARPRGHRREDGETRAVIGVAVCVGEDDGV